MLVNDEIDPPSDGGPGCGSEWFRYLRASFILQFVNHGFSVPAGMIPADVIEIAYRIHQGQVIPDEFTLEQNFPNPFNPATHIRFSLAEGTDVRLEIYNILGEKVVTILDDYLDAGQHLIEWDGTNSTSQPVPSGIYFYRLATDSFSESKKMLLVK